MKLILSLVCLMLVVNFAVAQEEITSAPGSYIHERIQTFGDERIEEVLYHQTFDEGIPIGWTNEVFDNNSIEIDAYWEYRSSNTTPPNAIGTRGNCEETGTGLGLPILSSTREDGFIIFDSDYWDSTEGDCGSFGTGLSPGPHNAYLTTESLDLSGHPYVGLKYNQYFKDYQATLLVQASISGGDFQTIHTATDGSNRSSSVRINISDIVGNEGDVKFRFTFEGLYYFWMIDDFQIVNLEENNLELNLVSHGTFNNATSSFQGMDYFKYPLTMIADLNLRASTSNQGGVAQSGVTLTATATNSLNEEIGSVNSSVNNLNPESEVTINAGQMSLESTIDKYNIEYEISQNETDDSPENNTANKSIEITDFTLARDEGPAQSFYTPTGDLSDIPYEVGTVYHVEQSGTSLHSISAGISANSEGGSYCYAKLYEIVVDLGITLTEVATTELQYTQAYHRNDFGDENMMVFDFDEPVNLVQGTSYLAVVRSLEGAQSVTFAMSGTSPDYTSIVVFNNGTPTYYLTETPMIRMNFGLVIGVEEEVAVQNTWNVEVFPNPTVDKLTVRYELNTASDVVVGLFDISGKHIEDLYMGTDSKGSHDLTVDVSSLSSGNYLIKVMSDQGAIEKKIVVQ